MEVNYLVHFAFLANKFSVSKQKNLNLYILKWEIHDTLGRLGSSEDTFTQVYVYDLTKIHHYDHHNMFWDRSRHLNTISRYLKQSYDSLNDDYEYALKWKIHDTLSRLGSSEDTFTQVYVYDLTKIHHYTGKFWGGLIEYWDPFASLGDDDVCILSVR